MCNCIKELTKKDFIERQTIFDDKKQDYIETNDYIIRRYLLVSSNRAKPTNEVFLLNYCPACGESLKRSNK